MVNYKDLGLVNTREMFARAIKGGYAIPAFNFNPVRKSSAWRLSSTNAAVILTVFWPTPARITTIT